MKLKPVIKYWEEYQYSIGHWQRSYLIKENGHIAIVYLDNFIPTNHYAYEINMGNFKDENFPCLSGAAETVEKAKDIVDKFLIDNFSNHFRILGPKHLILE